MIVNLSITVILLLAFIGFASRRLLTYLHAFQQEEYDGPRFIGWMFSNRVLDRKLTGILLASGVLWFLLPHFITDLMVLLGIAVMAYSEKDPRQGSKKNLAMTDRAKRIYGLALGLASLMILVLTPLVYILDGMAWLWILPVHALPFLMVLANQMLQPFETSLQNKYWTEAHERLKELNPVVIGVTGSFGKTSVKHILGHILNTVAPTLVTPGSVNTPMGIARIIREQLNETHKYVIVEMGAYGPGSIERICKLTPPNFGIVTSIGHAHYERFKSLDAVAQTKFELAEAVLANNGTMVVNEKALKFKAASDIYAGAKESFILCGPEADNGLMLKAVQQTAKGLEIRTSWNGEGHLLDVPLYGAHHAENITLAYGMAVKLGIPPETVEAALRSVPQIQHRLEVKRNAKTGSIIIDDAFNSNPAGFTAALDLLDFIGEKRRTILITPGMVELGKVHDEVHKQIGAYAASKCKICIAVQPKRIPTFVEAFKGAGTEAQLMEMSTFEEAQRWLAGNMNDNDVVLLENDLPDVYERVPKL